MRSLLTEGEMCRQNMWVSHLLTLSQKAEISYSSRRARTLFALSYRHGDPLQTRPEFENSAALFLRKLMGETVGDALDAVMNARSTPHQS
jgi:hypothetical protein